MNGEITRKNVIEALATLELLAIPSTIDELTRQYRKVISARHPDKFQIESDIHKATLIAQSINTSRELLEHIIDDSIVIDATLSDDHEARPHTHHNKSRYSRDSNNYTPGFPDETVFEYFVKSSHIISAGYNKNSLKMYVKFEDGSVYEYCELAPETFDAFMQAESHGKFSHQFIFRQHKYRRCEEPNRPYRPDLVFARKSGQYNSDPGFRIN